MAEEHTNKSPEVETNVAGEEEVESTDRGLFDFMGKKEEDKPQEEVPVTEFDKVKIEETKAEEEGEEKKKHGLLEKLHRSDSSSSSPETPEKKGFLKKIKEKLPVQHKKAEVVSAPPPVPPTAAAAELHHEGDAKEKKGILEKIKEKLPGYHSKTDEEKEKDKA
ncbi:hypothetical protein V6N13_139157 [Hibiscus sabdariffa]|uniref:Dehydrin n=1 Tax=Hibiscus sabdariffa TaxID=183260 RepID=A0ABR2PL91_9ROSI